MISIQANEFSLGLQTDDSPISFLPFYINYLALLANNLVFYPTIDRFIPCTDFYSG